MKIVNNVEVQKTLLSNGEVNFIDVKMMQGIAQGNAINSDAIFLVFRSDGELNKFLDSLPKFQNWEIKLLAHVYPEKRN